MAAPLHPRVLDELLDGLLRACCDCDCPTGHELQRWVRAGEVWWSLSACLLCPCPGGRDRARLGAPAPLRLVPSRNCECGGVHP